APAAPPPPVAERREPPRTARRVPPQADADPDLRHAHLRHRCPLRPSTPRPRAALVPALLPCARSCPRLSDDASDGVTLHPHRQPACGALDAATVEPDPHGFAEVERGGVHAPLTDARVRHVRPCRQPSTSLQTISERQVG